MKCKHCGKEIFLVPSATERAKKYHTKCTLDLRKKGVTELMIANTEKVKK